MLWAALAVTAPLLGQPESGFPTRSFTAAGVFGALQQAYPDWVFVHPGFLEPVLTVAGRDFVWAEGRLLPLERASRWNQFTPQPFYEYPTESPDVASWSPERVADTS